MNRSLRRKLGYLLGMMVLVFPIAWLGQPATQGTAERPASAGGKLAQVRVEQQISQANLGEIDPAGATLKLAVLGLDQPAAMALWMKALDAKMREDWTTFQATLVPITKLQPNYARVWTHLAWNVSYNISVEFDDYRDRYRWIKKGIAFLEEGIRYNRHDPRILWEIGWYLSNKLGRADERQQYRALFRADREFYPDVPEQRRDNWLVGKTWFRKAEEAVDNHGQQIRDRSPVVFYAQAPLCQIYYAATIEEEGIFGERARLGWEEASLDWDALGRRDVRYGAGPETIRLGDLERAQAEAVARLAELDQLHPGVHDQLLEANKQQLSAEERQALEAPFGSLTADQRKLAYQALRRIRITAQQIGEEIIRQAPHKADEAVRLVAAAAHALELAERIDRHRDPIDFGYWSQRALAERTDAALSLREDLFDAEQAYIEKLDLPLARRLYERAFDGWTGLVRHFPALRLDHRTVDDWMPRIEQYSIVLGRMNESLPADFVLNEIIEQWVPPNRDNPNPDPGPGFRYR